MTPGTQVRSLLRWYDAHRRDLPWRAALGRKAEPYEVLVSEVMLQQTTAATVAKRFDGFLARFPNLQALAEADQAEVLHEWQGLGYYRRARALHACAQAVVERCDGTLPSDEKALRALPGIGAYTARAILSIAFDQPHLPVDANIARVLARFHGIETPMPSALAALQARADALDTRGRPGDVAQALMDLGATICRPRAPQCGSCPWQRGCVADAAGTAEALPRRAAKPERPLRRGLAFLLTRPDGAILFRRRREEGLLGGLHELPGSPWLPGPLSAPACMQYAPLEVQWRLASEPVTHVFTHFRLELTLAEARTDVPPEGLWCDPRQLHELALPTVMKKLLRLAGYRPRAMNR